MDKEKKNDNIECGDVAINELDKESSQHVDETDVSKHLQLPFHHLHKGQSDGKVAYAIRFTVYCLSVWALQCLYGISLSNLFIRLLGLGEKSTPLFNFKALVGIISTMALIFSGTAIQTWIQNSKNDKVKSKVDSFIAIHDCFKLIVIALHLFLSILDK